jgi:uncharacterized protein involved in tolerance to divalent cations
MRTREELFEKVCEKVKEIHKSEAPEIIVVPIVNGLTSYLKWLNDSLQT